MELIKKLENQVLVWVKNVPHLPAAGQKWLGQNVWWIVLVFAIIIGITILGSFFGLLVQVALLGAPSSAYYITGNYAALNIITAVVSLVFSVAGGLLLALAVKPLQNMQKKGWVLLFMTLLVSALSVVVHAVLSFSVLGFIILMLFGAIGLAIGAYFIFEIHSQFGHALKPEPTVEAKKLSQP